MDTLTTISNFFFVTGALLISSAVLSMIASAGGFMGLKYIWYWFTAGISRKKISEPRKDYYTFQKEFFESKDSSEGIRKRLKMIILIIGAVCVIISLITAACIN